MAQKFKSEQVQKEHADYLTRKDSRDDSPEARLKLAGEVRDYVGALVDLNLQAHGVGEHSVQVLNREIWFRANSYAADGRFIEALATESTDVLTKIKEELRFVLVSAESGPKKVAPVVVDDREEPEKKKHSK